MLSAISLFAGIGGFDVALKQQQVSVICANEINRFAAITYRNNFPTTNLIEGDIKSLHTSAFPSSDILTAGFPCQSFSVMGKQKGLHDSRGALFFDIIRLLKNNQIPIVLLENVANIIYHDNGNTLNIIINSLIELGYHVKYTVLCPSTHANIPQIRKRFFLVAFLDSSTHKKFMFPYPIPLTKTINSLIDTSQPRTAFYYYDHKSVYYKQLIENVTSPNAIYRIDDWGVAKRRYDICPTLKANMGTFPDRVPLIKDNFGIRRLTPLDCLKLQGFPDTFFFKNIPLNEAYKQIGNSVCVPLLNRIISNILMAIT